MAVIHMKGGESLSKGIGVENSERDGLKSKKPKGLRQSGYTACEKNLDCPESLGNCME